jgi:hypothetical protein
VYSLTLPHAQFTMMHSCLESSMVAADRDEETVMDRSDVGFDSVSDFLP